MKRHIKGKVNDILRMEIFARSSGFAPYRNMHCGSFRENGKTIVSIVDLRTHALRKPDGDILFINPEMIKIYHEPKAR